MPFHVCYLFKFVDCFEILTCHVFLHSVCSVCFIRRCIFQVIRKKKKEFFGFSFNSYNFAILTILETFVFHTEIYKFRIFIRSLCCFYFSSCLRRDDLCVVVVVVVFFFPTRSTRTCRCHGKWSLFGFSVVFVVKFGSESVTMFRVLWFVLNAEQGSRVEYKVLRQ